MLLSSQGEPLFSSARRGAARCYRWLVVLLVVASVPACFADDPEHVPATPTSSIGSHQWDELRAVPPTLDELLGSGECPVSEYQRPVPDFIEGLGHHHVFVNVDGTDRNARVTLPHEDIFDAGDPVEMKLQWYSSPEYRGPLLLRFLGPVVDSSTAVDISAGTVREFRLSEQSAQPTPGLDGWRNWLVIYNLRGFGCYGVQVDGLGFSEVIVFEVVAESNS